MQTVWHAGSCRAVAKGQADGTGVMVLWPSCTSLGGLDRAAPASGDVDTDLFCYGPACAPDCSEERHCRFCQTVLPDWKDRMHAGNKQSTPYMRVSFNGKTHKVPVKPGEEGQAEFAAAIRKLLTLPEEQEFDVSAVYVFLRAPLDVRQSLTLVVTACCCCRAGHLSLQGARLR